MLKRRDGGADEEGGPSGEERTHIYIVFSMLIPLLLVLLLQAVRRYCVACGECDCARLLVGSCAASATGALARQAQGICRGDIDVGHGVSAAVATVGRFGRAFRAAACALFVNASPVRDASLHNGTVGSAVLGVVFLNVLDLLGSDSVVTDTDVVRSRRRVSGFSHADTALTFAHEIRHGGRCRQCSTRARGVFWCTLYCRRSC